MRRSAAERRPGDAYAVELPLGVHGEIARIAIDSVLGKLSDMPAREATQILAQVRRATQPAVEVLGWLRSEDPARPAIEVAMEAAHRRADARKAVILRDPAMLSGARAAERLGVSRETINKRAQQGRLLALEFGKRGRRYPAWQFDDDVAGAGLERVLDALRPLGAWEQYRFFTQSQPALGGRTAVESLRADDSDAVLAAAESWAAGEQGGG